MQMVEEDEIPFLGEVDGYRIILLEFPHSHLVFGADKLVHWLLNKRIRPLITHPERNKDPKPRPQDAVNHQPDRHQLC